MTMTRSGKVGVHGPESQLIPIDRRVDLNIGCWQLESIGDVNQTSYCPACRDEFEFIPERIEDDAVNCPHCRAKVPVFNADTWVPVGALSNDEIKPSEVKIDGYEILQPLGKGGMGVVLEGRQISLGRRVAIKFLMPSLTRNQVFVERFEREAAALARLSHPNIVTIFERGRTLQGVYFIMEFVEGSGGGAPQDLRMLLNQRRLTIAEVKQFALQVIRALGYAHQQGIVHRDIKPGNVMIDRHGNAKVADFGIASIDSQRQGMQLTVPSTPLGTSDYMAPEQRDNATKIDQRADVYSVGVLLYEMLTGELPRGAYQPPSQSVPGIDLGWDQIVELTLQPRPEKRLGDMEELDRRIESIPITSTGSDRVAAASSEEVMANADMLDSSVNLFCAECGIGVSRETRFCPSCRATQWAQCPGCERTNHASLRFCPSCGDDIQSYRLLQKYTETARSALTIANDEKRLLAERCHHAQQAGLAASRAVKYSADSESTRELLALANRCLLTLARSAGIEAFKNRRLGEAQGFLEQILNIQPDHAESVSRLNEIQKYYLEGRAKADQFLAVGLFAKAANVLEKLVESFPNDAELTNRLEESRRNHQHVEDVVQRIIPALASQNKWYAVRREIIELNKAGIEVRGLSDYAVVVDGKLAETAMGIRKTQDLLFRGKIREATQRAEKILQLIADHPQALEVLANARQMDQQVRELNRRLESATNNGEWFQASAMLAAAGPEIHAMPLQDLECTLRKGCRQADNYARLLIWTILGAGLMLVGTKFLGLLLTGIEDLLPQNDTQSRFWQTDNLRTACTLAFAILIGVGNLTLLRVILRRPAYPKRIGFWVAIGLAGAVFFMINHMFLIDIVNLTWIVRLLGLSGIGFTAGLIFGLASFDVVEPPMIKIVRTAFAGAAAVVILPFANEFQDDYTRFLMPAIWLSSLLLVTRIFSHWLQAGAVILAGLTASVLAVGVQRQYENWSESGLGLVAMVILTGTSIVAASNRRLMPTIVISGISCTVFGIFTMLSAYRPVLTLWLILTAAIAGQIRQELDPRLHIIDRIRARQKKSSTSTNSNGRHQEPNE